MKRPDENALVAAVECFGGSVSALDLLHYFEHQHYQEREIQRAIQRALNSGVLSVGPKLYLYTRKALGETSNHTPRIPSMMTENEHLLTCLAEECAEVAQRVSKALRFGLSEVQEGQPWSNAERISEEMRDLIAVARILYQRDILTDFDPSSAEVEKKHQKIQRFFAISREQGTLCASFENK